MRPFWAPLRYSNFRMVWIAQTASSIGSSLQAVALPWMILSQGHNTAFSLALALLSLALPQALLTLAGGFLVDLLDARSVMLWTDAIRILTAGSIAALSIMPKLHLWILCGILLLHGTANALFAPAAASMAPHLVAREHQTSANALLSMMVQIGPVLGYLPAGILVASLGPAWAFSLNALSYAFACLLVIHTTPLLRRQHKHKTSAFEEISESVRYLRKLRWLLALLVMDMFLALAAITTNSIGLPLLAKVEQAGASGLSMLLWGYSCGAVVGMFLPSLLVFRSHRGLLSISFQCIEAALIFFISRTPLLVAICCMCLWSLLNGILVVMTLSLIQERVMKEMLGRMTACWMFASSSMIPLAQLGGGLLASVIGVQTLFAITAVIALIGAMVGLSVADLRRLD